MALVAIGCKLPNGLSFLGADGKTRVNLNGSHQSRIIGATHGTTLITEADANHFFAKYEKLEAVKNGHVFRHGNSDKVENVDAIAKELKDVKTGLEGLDPRKPVAGIKPEDNQAMSSEEVEARQRGPKRAASKAKS